MPILTLDHMGRLVEADPNRSDGKGYKGPVGKVKESDVTFGHAMINSQRNSELVNHRIIASRNMEEQMGKAQAAQLLMSKRKANARAYALGRVRQTQKYQDKMTAVAAKQYQLGCHDLNVNPLTGNALTSDGQPMDPNPSMDIIPASQDEMNLTSAQVLLNAQLQNQAQINTQNANYDAANSTPNAAPVNTGNSGNTWNPSTANIPTQAAQSSSQYPTRRFSNSQYPDAAVLDQHPLCAELNSMGRLRRY